VWVQPAAGDAGGALGAALYVRHQLLERPRDPAADVQGASLLGPAVTVETARAALARHGERLRVEEFADDAALLAAVARMLRDGALVGWAQGRLEFGPRALGARSILADPTRADAKDVINARIKHREAFRPFAPAVLRERAAEWFEVPSGFDGPFMTFTAPVRPERRARIPAVTHVDGTARLQTVDARHGRFRGLLEAFEALSGCPVLLNTSFNDRGQPIVADAEAALAMFLASDLDGLVLDAFLVRRAA
jgi:carbamoyltransferase